MKRFFLISTILLSVSCWQLNSANIICTNYPVWLITCSITHGAENLEVSSLQPPGSGCAHEYHPSPNELRKLNASGAILIANGLGLDDHLLEHIKKLNPQLAVITAADPADKIDAHVFIAPASATRMIKRITEKLCELDPANAVIYRRNADALMLELTRLSGDLIRIAPQSKVVIQYPVFVHLALEGNLRYNILKQSRTTPLKSADYRNLLKENCREPAKIIIAELNTQDISVKRLATDGKIKYLELDSMLSGPVDPPAGYFLQIMSQNISKLQEALR